ncbi:MAG TPA: peptidoglycan-binding domain-containing protein [Ktedonobacteraceae bacterium]|nr:peptidoglycan-binding domain-containing protein [Ktedonobacteraceae bacterium]
MHLKFRSFLLSVLCAVTVLTLGGFSLSAHAATVQQASVSPGAHAVIATAACPATIHRGSQGALVRNLQNRLNALYNNMSDPRFFLNSPKDFGPFTQDPSLPLRVDGDFGTHTFNAVWDYQWWNAPLSVDGEVGPQTWHSLGAC